MSARISLDAWNDIALKRATEIAQRLRDDPHVAAAIEQRTAALATSVVADALDTVQRRREIVFLDVLSRRLRTIDDLPQLDLDASRRIRIVAQNATRHTLRAAIAANAVCDPVVIITVEEADVMLRAATLAQLPKLAAGRVDLAAERRFGTARDGLLRPLLVPPPPALPQAIRGEARLGFLADEMEWVWTAWIPTGNPRLPMVPAVPVTHKAARAITSFSAGLLDSRLARGGRWDRVLDAARIRCGTGDRDNVLFDAVAFATWWASLSN